MDKEDALIREMIKDRDDIGRVVGHVGLLADVWEESGDPRGEYARIWWMQQQPTIYKDHEGLAQRKAELLAEHQEQWQPKALESLRPHTLHDALPDWQMITHLPPEYFMPGAAWNEAVLGVRTLQVDWAHLTDANISVLAEHAPKFKHLGTLLLRCNEIGDAGAITLAGHAGEFKHLLSLDLYYNRIGEAGARALAERAAEFKHLRGLNLISNSITDAGAIALAEHAADFKHLEWLGLSQNSITDTGARALAAHAAEFKQLQTLHLARNSIGNHGTRVLGESDFPELRNIYIDDDALFASSLAAQRRQKRPCIPLPKLETINDRPLSYYNIPTVEEAQAIRDRARAPSGGGVTPSDVVGDRREPHR